MRQRSAEIGSAQAVATAEWFIVDAPHFYAAADVGADGFVTRTAPILKWARGRRFDRVRSYCQRKYWLLTIFYTDGSMEFAP